jgi:hypothetical protein
VEVHGDHFPEAEYDNVWLEAAGRRGWVVITKDKAIRHRDVELGALKAAGVAAFVLTARGNTGEQNGAILAKALPRMSRFLVGNRPPFIAGVSATSRITMLYRGRKPRQRGPKARSGMTAPRDSEGGTPRQ